MADRVIFGCTVLLAALYLFAAEQLPSLTIGDPLGPRAFPRLLGAGLIIVATLLAVEMLRARKRAPAEAPQRESGAPRAYAIVASAALWTFAYILVFERLGYVAATTVYVFALTAYFNRGRWVVNTLTSVLFCLASYFLFTRILGVTLPGGVLPL